MVWVRVRLGLVLRLKHRICKKSVVLRIGPRYNYACVPLTVNGAILSYVDQCKYLGIVLTSFRYFKCLFDHVKLKFYRCFNTVFYRSKNAGSELVSVQLMQSICPLF